MSSHDDRGASPPQGTTSPAAEHVADIQATPSRPDEHNAIVQATPSRPEPSIDGTSPELGHPYSASEKHPKGRRKRTAAKDKYVLEAAYNENPKPDKTARLELVRRVSLNEKEVQIWFQNRRQNDRRKSRPLSPQEIAALRTGGLQLLSSDPITSSSQTEDCTSPRADTAPSSVPRGDVSATPFMASGRAPDVPSSRFTYRFGSPGESADGSTMPRPLPPHESPLATYGSSTSFSGTRARPSDRWNPDMSFSSCFTPEAPNGSARLRPFFTSSPSGVPAGSGLPTPQSQVRLSLSLEGKAELVSQLNSPPRTRSIDLPSSPVPRPRALLQRSQSAAAHVTLPPISALTDDLPPTLRNGRSRDAQAWEQCCESDTRDELTTQAENESSGSAVAAISLLRSTSGVLQPNSAKRNAPPLSWKPLQGKRPRLSRTMSSNAVMQSDRSSSPVSVLKPANLPAGARSPSGDSDKENWSPVGESTARNAPPQMSLRKVLGMGPPHAGNVRRQGRAVRDQHAPWLMTKGRDRGRSPLPRQSSAGSDLEIFEDAESNKTRRGSDEVESFMRGEVSPGKKGDMDCIAGLLSLSQGNWR